MKNFYEMLEILKESGHDLRGYDAWLTQPPYGGERLNPDQIEWDEDWTDDSEGVKLVGGRFVDRKGRHLPWLDPYAREAAAAGETDMWIAFERKTGSAWYHDGRHPGPDGSDKMEVAIDIRNAKLEGNNFQIALDRVGGKIASHFFGGRSLEYLSSESVAERELAESDYGDKEYMDWLRAFDSKFYTGDYRRDAQDRDNLYIGRITWVLDELGETSKFWDYVGGVKVAEGNYYMLLDRLVKRDHPQMYDRWKLDHPSPKSF